MCRSSAVFTADERSYCRSRPDEYTSLCGLLCAKEAFIKALSSFAEAPAYTFPEIEIVHGPGGRPRVRPHGRLGEWCARRALAIDLSISHTEDTAGAVVVLLNLNHPRVERGQPE